MNWCLNLALSYPQMMAAADSDGALNFSDPVYAMHSFNEACKPMVPVQPVPLLLG